MPTISKNSKETHDKFVSLYLSGVSFNNICREFPVSYKYLRKYFNKLGLPDNKHKKQKYLLNENFFEKIDTPKKAYWLGWLYSDGCVHPNSHSYTIGLKLQSKDKYIIQNFINAIESNSPPIEQKETNSHSVVICNRKMGEDLIKHGCFPNKSLTLKWPENVPEHLLPYFLRGVFEGDGTVSNLKRKDGKTSRISCEIACSRFFSASLSTYLSNNNIKNAVYKKKNIDVVYIGAKWQFCKFYNLIYSGELDNMLLYRKYQRFLDIIDSFLSKYYQI